MATRPTIQDIAQKAGVGAGTVSRVLNNHPYVSEITRQKVLETIDELNYRPSFKARQMRTSRSQLIGFITDEVATTPYAGDIIKGAQEVAWNNDRILMVVSAGDHNLRTKEAVETLLEREVEGIIYAAMYHRPVQLPEKIAEVPTVLANCFVEDRSLPSVVPDEFLGGFQATEALLKRGRRRIAFINFRAPNNPIPAAIGRLAGYKHALEQYGVPYNPELVRESVREGIKTSHDGYDFGLELLQLPNPPDAFFCFNDQTAMGVYDAMREMNRKVRKDISIVGFDNLEIIASALHPALSTMQLPHYEMGLWAANHVISQATEGEVAPVQHKLLCPYIERGSV